MSEHFPRAEMERTDTGLANVCPPELLPNLDALCDRILEPWRLVSGRLRTRSGFRAPAVNRAVGGKPTSQHLRGEAADEVPLDKPLVAAFEDLVGLSVWLPLGQAILYPHEGFIHASIDLTDTPRRQLWVCIDPTRQAPLVPWEDWRP